jgi:hypothetical protein
MTKQSFQIEFDDASLITPYGVELWFGACGRFEHDASGAITAIYVKSRQRRPTGVHMPWEMRPIHQQDGSIYEDLHRYLATIYAPDIQDAIAGNRRDTRMASRIAPPCQRAELA